MSRPDPIADFLASSAASDDAFIAAMSQPIRKDIKPPVDPVGEEEK